MMISQGAFFMFFKFWFFRLLGGEREKMVQNDKKFLSIALHISGTIHDMDVVYGIHL